MYREQEQIIVTNLTLPSRAVVRFYAGSAEAIVAGLTEGAMQLTSGEVVVDVLGDSLVATQVPNLTTAFQPAVTSLIPVLP